MGEAVLTADSRLSSKARFFRLDHILTFMLVIPNIDLVYLGIPL